jgi:hypothetical protein
VAMNIGEELLPHRKHDEVTESPYAKERRDRENPDHQPSDQSHAAVPPFRISSV